MGWWVRRQYLSAIRTVDRVEAQSRIEQQLPLVVRLGFDRPLSRYPLWDRFRWQISAWIRRAHLEVRWRFMWPIPSTLLSTALQYKFARRGFSSPSHCGYQISFTGLRGARDDTRLGGAVIAWPENIPPPYEAFVYSDRVDARPDPRGYVLSIARIYTGAPPTPYAKGMTFPEVAVDVACTLESTIGNPYMLYAWAQSVQDTEIRMREFLTSRSLLGE